ncbi:hypothetical protein BH23PLA1_BH23PLA1_09500 [soil metagenome]
MVRRRYYFDGRVQGVGFRATTHQLARHHPVSGTVRNLDDGRVEVVAEGSAEALKAFVSAIQTALGRHIRNVRAEELPTGEPFAGFRVVN